MTDWYSANEATLKRTVAPSDVFSALSELEFDAFRARLEKELDAYSELKAGKRRGKKSAGGESAGGPEKEGDTTREAKRVKTVATEAEGDSMNTASGDLPAEDDGDETQEEPEMLEEEDHNEEDEGEEEDEDEDEGEHERGDEEDINRVEDLDDPAKRSMDPDADSDHSDSDTDGPSAQLRHDMGFG